MKRATMCTKQHRPMPFFHDATVYDTRDKSCEFHDSCLRVCDTMGPHVFVRLWHMDFDCSFRPKAFVLDVKLDTNQYDQSLRYVYDKTVSTWKII